MSFKLAYSFQNNISVTSGVTFLTQGAKREISLTDSKGNPTSFKEMEHTYQYIQFPLLLGYSYTFSEKWSAQLMGGAYVGVLLKAGVQLDNTPMEWPHFTDKAVNANSDFGLLGEMNIAYNVSEKWKLLLVVNFSFGLKNILKEPLPILKHDAVKFNSWYIGVGVGYSIHLGE